MKNKVRNIFAVCIYMIMTWVEAYAGISFYLVYSKQWNLKKVPKEKKVDKREILLFCCSVILFYVAIILFYFGNWVHAIKFHGITIVSSWELLVCQIAPIIYYIKSKKCKEEETGTKKKDKLVLLLAILFPLILSSISLFLSRGNRIFSPNDMVEEICYSLISAALLEELYFRFFLYRFLKRIVSRVFTAQVISSALFALWHISLVIRMLYFGNSMNHLYNLIIIFFVGMISTTIYEKTGKIRYCIAFHALNNNLIYYILELIKSIIYF